MGSSMSWWLNFTENPIQQSVSCPGKWMKFIMAEKMENVHPGKCMKFIMAEKMENVCFDYSIPDFRDGVKATTGELVSLV